MSDADIVRTTLDLDDDVLLVLRELAEVQRVTIGRMTSLLVRRALERPESAPIRNGVPLFPRRPSEAPRPTMRRVNELRDSD